ncbi:MAG: Smr/MutS family protein [Saprospiraceae bacterium]|nr:Smr/MutS family protein [Saprospiraceae bacterium]
MVRKSERKPANVKSWSDLGFDVLLDQVCQLAQFSESAQRILIPNRKVEAEVVRRQLRLSEQILESGILTKLSFDDIQNPDSLSKMLAVDHFVLEISDLLNLRNIARNATALRESTHIFHKDVFSELQALCMEVSGFRELLTQFDRVFDEHHNIRDGATPELWELRKQMHQVNQSIYRVFKKALDSYKRQSFLAPEEESVYQGRYVLRVLSEHKRKVRGIVCGESESGRTTFIEPESCVELHNELTELEHSAKREILKILRSLTALCAEQFSTLCNAYEQLISFDVLCAKARFSARIGGVAPIIADEPRMHIVSGYHPLLLLKLQEQGMKPVPLDISINENQRLIVISGPNAGGKSIVLKTIGLYVCMLRQGILIPASRKSECYVFDRLLVDIGDHQSLDNDLSTYTAKLKFMQTALAIADVRTLALIDEFGSGTDPAIGGAIAESVLEELASRKCMGVITTHYSDIKAMAHKLEGLGNASMLFDEVERKPAFKLMQGVPGSSYALEMAERMKLPAKVLKRAKLRMGKGILRMESLIADLEAEKRRLSADNSLLNQKIASLNKLIQAYERMNRDVDLKKLKLKLADKMKNYDNRAELFARNSALVREIEEKLDIIAAKKLAESSRSSLKDAEVDYQKVYQAVHAFERNSSDMIPISKGSEVIMISSGVQGTVSRVSNEMAEVTTDKFTLFVPISELAHAKPKKAVSSKASSKSVASASELSIKPLLDLRGIPVEDALKELETYIDKVILSNFKEVRVLHGKGTGALRRAVLQWVRKNKFIISFRHPDDADGGNGVTILSLQ